MLAILVGVILIFFGFFCLPIFYGLLLTLLSSLGWDLLGNSNSLNTLSFANLEISPFITVLTNEQFLPSLMLTVFTGVTATILSLCTVFFIAGGWFHTVRYRSKKFLPILLSFPHTSFAIGLVFLVSPSGLLMRLLAHPLGITIPPDWSTYQDPYGISLIVGLVFKESIFLLFMVLSKISQIDIENQLRVSYTLGYSRAVTWMKIIWPQIYRGIRFPLFIVLSYSLSPIDMAIVLAGKTPPPFALLILNWFYDPDLSFMSMSAAGSILLISLFIIIAILWICGEKKYFQLVNRSIWNGKRKSMIPQSPWISRVLFSFITLTMLLSLAMNFIWSITRSWPFPAVIPTKFTLSSWQFLYNANTIDLIFNTIVIAFVVAGGSLLLSIFMLEIDAVKSIKRNSSWLNLLRYPFIKIIIFLPLLIPSVSLYLGVKWFFSFNFSTPLYLSFVMVGHFLIVFPYTFLTLEETYRGYNRQYFILGQTLSHSTLKVLLKIKLPMLIKPILVSLAIGLSISIMDYLATTVLSSGRISTITTEAIQLSDGGNRRVVGFFAVFQTFFLGLIFLPHFKKLFNLKTI